MFDHVGFSTGDLARLRRFYEAALAPLGITCLMEVTADMTGGDAFLGFGKERPQFWLSTGTRHAPGIHIAFAADDRATVDAFYKAALAAGGRDNGPRASGHIITPIIMEHSCWTPMDTTSRRSATSPLHRD